MSSSSSTSPLVKIAPTTVFKIGKLQVPIRKCADKLILKIIEIYEKKYKIFSALGIRKYGEIYNKIRKMLLLNLNIDIETLFYEDYNSFSSILASVYCSKYALYIEIRKNMQCILGEPELEYVLEDSAHPLHTIMVMCYSTHYMKKLLEKKDYGHVLQRNDYAHLKESLEELACKVINHLDLSGEQEPSKVMEALQEDYTSKFSSSSVKNKSSYSYHDYLTRKFRGSQEIMAIAYKAKAMKFLSQGSCTNLLMSRNSKKAKGKYLLHLIYRVFFILAFAYMLCYFPFYSSQEKEEEYSFTQYFSFFYVLAELAAQMLMTVIKTIDYSMAMPQGERFDGFQRYTNSHKLGFFRFVLVIPILILESVQEFAFPMFVVQYSKHVSYRGWHIIPIILEILYCILFLIATVSTLRFFEFIKSLGFFIHILKKMIKTVLMFVVIFCTFWFVLAVIHVSISRTVFSSDNTFWYIFSSQGKFEIFGEVQEDDRVGNLPNCGVYNRTISDIFKMDYAEASCLIRSSVMPFLVFGYIFVSGILLVNLLTAQLTKEYEKESENSSYYNGYLKYGQFMKIDSKLFLPPPFSLIYIFLRFLFLIILYVINVINVIRSFTGIYCDSYCLPKAQKGLWKFTEFMEGYPWGAVRGSKKTGAEKAIRKFLESDRNDADQIRQADLKSVMATIQKEIVESRTGEAMSRAQSRLGQRASVEDSRKVQLANFFNKAETLITTYDENYVDSKFFAILNNRLPTFLKDVLTERKFGTQPSREGPSRQTIHEEMEDRESDEDEEIDEDVMKEVAILIE